MYQFIVPQVKKPLDGEVEISGAKNAVLAVMAAALLADGVSEITNVPHLKDMKTMSDVLRVIGCHISGEAHCLKIDTRGADHLEAPYELVKTMRASMCWARSSQGSDVAAFRSPAVAPGARVPSICT